MNNELIKAIFPKNNNGMVMIVLSCLICIAFFVVPKGVGLRECILLSLPYLLGLFGFIAYSYFKSRKSIAEVYQNSIKINVNGVDMEIVKDDIKKFTFKESMVYILVRENEICFESGLFSETDKDYIVNWLSKNGND